MIQLSQDLDLSLDFLFQGKFSKWQTFLQMHHFSDPDYICSDVIHFFF